MSSNVVIRATNLSKSYRIYDRPFDRVRQILSLGGKRHYREFQALKDVSFEIRKGETVGIIGRNGSGKSTLLQLICGILKPTSGSISVNGRISALLELGAGFHPEFTGRENVYMQGAVMGINREEMDARFDDIAAFADIGEFIEQPVKIYSSGMMVRLAFAAQVMFAPNILIIDEALGVGDLFFQQQCMRRIRSLCDEGVTLLFVSHDSNVVKNMCRHAIYLDSGSVSFSGPTQLAMARYLDSTVERAVALPDSLLTPSESATDNMVKSMISKSVWTRATNVPRYSPGQLIAVFTSDCEGNACTTFAIGVSMRVQILYIPDRDKATHVSVLIKNRYDQVITVMGSSRLGLKPPVYKSQLAAILELNVPLLLESGSYSICVVLGHLISPNQGETIDATDPIGPITVEWDYENKRAPFLGMFGLPVSGEFKTVTSGMMQ